MKVIFEVFKFLDVHTIMELFKFKKELSLEFESVNILIAAGPKHDMIAGGDEGKLHLINKDLKLIRSTYVGACLHAGIVVGNCVYVSVKNDSYKLQVFELSSFRLLHTFPI